MQEKYIKYKIKQKKAYYRSFIVNRGDYIEKNNIHDINNVLSIYWWC